MYNDTTPLLSAVKGRKNKLRASQPSATCIDLICGRRSTSATALWTGLPLAVLNEAKVDGRHGHEFIHPFYPAELVIQYYHHEQALDKTFGPSIILRVGREETKRKVRLSLLRPGCFA